MKLPAHNLLTRVAFTACIVLATLLFARQAVITYHDTVTFGGSDLRVRIIGSRLMEAGLDPFFTKWQPDMGPYLCDPNDTYDRPMNGVTVTPFALWLQQPLAWLPYPTIRMLWWGCQQFLLLFITCICAYICRRSIAAVAAICICATALANHPAWILHAERGQLYILFAAWVVILFALWRHKSRRTFTTIAIWLAIGVLMRPNLILFGVPVLLTTPTLRGKIILTATGAICLLVLLTLSNTWQYWPPYFSALQLYVNRAIGSLRFAPHPAPLRPTLIEGATNITHYRRNIEFEYLKPLNVYLAEYGIWPGRKFYLLLSLLLNGLWLLLSYVKNGVNLSAEQMLMLAMLLYVSADVCQPFRASYSIVVWLPVVLVAVGYSFSGFSFNLVPARVSPTQI